MLNSSLWRLLAEQTRAGIVCGALTEAPGLWAPQSTRQASWGIDSCQVLLEGRLSGALWGACMPGAQNKMLGAAAGAALAADSDKLSLV